MHAHCVKTKRGLIDEKGRCYFQFFLCCNVVALLKNKSTHNLFVLTWYSSGEQQTDQPNGCGGQQAMDGGGTVQYE